MITTLKTIARAFYVELKGKEEMRIASWHLGKFKPNATEEQVIIDLGHNFLESKDLNFLTINDAQHLYSALGALLDDVAASYPLLTPPRIAMGEAPSSDFNLWLLDMFEPSGYTDIETGQDVFVLDKSSVPYCRAVHAYPAHLSHIEEEGHPHYGRWEMKSDTPSLEFVERVEENLKSKIAKGAGLGLVGANETSLKLLNDALSKGPLESRDETKLELTSFVPTTYHGPLYGNESSDTRTAVMDARGTPYCLQIHSFPPRLHESHQKAPGRWVTKDEFKDFQIIAEIEAYLRNPNGRDLYYVDATEEHIQALFEECGGKKVEEAPEPVTQPTVLVDKARTPFCDQIHHPKLCRGGKRDMLWKLKPFQELGQVRNAEAWLRLQLPRLRKDFHIISSPKFVLLHLRKGDSGLSTDVPSHLVNELYKDEKPRVYLDGSDVPFSEVVHIGGLNAMGGPHNSFRWFPKAGLSEGYVLEMITKLKQQLKAMENLDLVEVVRDVDDSRDAIAAGTIGYQFKLDGTVEDVETQGIQQS